jgi:hypothetical protein
LVIDEVQAVPDIISYIKIIVDRNDRPGDFLLTGSVDFLRFSKITESLAGRTVLQRLYPFSVGELKQRDFSLIDSLFDGSIIHKLSSEVLDFGQIAERLVTGFFPEAIKLSSIPDIHQWFESYVKSRILKDFEDLTEKKLHKLHIVPRLLQLLANQTASIIKKNKISQDLHITYPTTITYLSLLETLFIIDFIQPFFPNVGKQAIRSPKMYFVDTGLLAYLLNLTPDLLLEKYDQYFGQFLENFVFNELQKEISYSHDLYKIYFYRDNKQNEVDFIIEKFGGDLICIEVKAKSKITAKDLSGMRFFHNRFAGRIKGLYVFYGGQVLSATKINGQTVILLPVGALF